MLTGLRFSGNAGGESARFSRRGGGMKKAVFKRADLCYNPFQLFTTERPDDSAGARWTAGPSGEKERAN